MITINTMAAEVLKSSLIGGDVLVRLFYDKKRGIRVQMIDGGSVSAVITSAGNFPNILENGNELRYGVEISPDGEDVAYWIRNRDLKYERIEARSKTGHQVAFLVKGSMYRPQDCRGIPLISVVLETLAKLERYKEATVGSAEERAKIPYFIEHGVHSDGENPLLKGLAEATRGGTVIGGNADGRLPQTVQGEELANKVYASTNKQVYNMPIGAKINAVDTKSDLHFAEFYNKNIDIICAALGIPPDVAFQKYENSYSSSRAALKDWEHTLKVERDRFAEQFYKPIYEFWLMVNVFEGKIKADGFTEAILNNNDLIVTSYTQSRFIGDNVPHIDPVKEVQAERLKLGERGKNIPLTTVEDATEALNSGDAVSNVKQFANELHEAEESGLVTEVPPMVSMPVKENGKTEIEEDEEEED
jgi:capsid protein